MVVIMAQIGCFVPARQAVIPVRDRLLTRMGTGDDMEHNLSTFLIEMRDTAYILRNLTSKSLVLVDELGRGTSNIDGMSIAIAVAESLLQSTAFSIYVSHYPQITALASFYPTLKNVHLRTILSAADESLHYLHELISGPCEMDSGYGILMAETSGFPANVIADARRISVNLRRAFPSLLGSSGTQKQQNITNSLLQQLLLLKLSYSYIKLSLLLRL